MSTQATSGDETWSKLADLSEEERQAAILERLNELASLPEDERVSKARAMAEAEYSLPDDKLRSFALSRLRTFLKMDPEDAKRIIATNDIDIVMRQMPGGIAMRRIMLLQTLAREFPPAEQEQLLTLAPQIFASQVTPPVPPRTPEAATPAAPERAAPASTATPTAPAKKPWWAFWQK